ncbi:MAG: homogentisate 1,2-dioxygenase [Leucothrix sp.]
MKTQDNLSYLTGFGNEFESEAAALPDVLPQGQFNPQRVSYGLYTEQFSSTAFTAPRAENRRTWFYRIRPSVLQGEFAPVDNGLLQSAPILGTPPTPNVLRWSPFPLPETTDAKTFVSGLLTLGANGNVAEQQGIGIHLYLANTSMHDTFFYNADGEMLLVPEQGGLLLHTECGILSVQPGEIAVIPRGMKFRVVLTNNTARGYVCENYGMPFTLPERGPVGANGFANDRDFMSPVAAYEDREGDFTLSCKFMGQLYQADIGHSPLDVVAWAGNSVPYKYDLSRFNVINSVSFDHPDPSIFTVLSSPSSRLGTANVDFVIFPPRWLVAENTFRPPWYHRNVMSEFMGLIRGVYDAKEAGFEPGGASLHNSFAAHGPEAAVFERASAADLTPQQYKDTLAFMFESRYPIHPAEHAMQCPQRQGNYSQCWADLKKHFTGEKR